MAQFKRRVVSVDIEKKILTGLIVSDQYFRNVFKMIDLEYFSVDYIKLIAGWCIKYFNDYYKAPGKHIEDIFIIEKEKLKSDEIELVEFFLRTISEEYENADILNIPYLVGNTEDYFKRRSLTILFEVGQRLIAAGRITEANKLLDQHKLVISEISGVFDLFDEDVIDAFDLDNRENRLFKINGPLGDLLGWFERSWLVSFTAPEKGGKSWWLEEIVFQALYSRLKVLWISLEMNKVTLQIRGFRRLTAMADKNKIIKHSVFDCENNQKNNCEIPQRTCDKGLVDEDGEEVKRVEFDEDSGYVPCTYCRDNKNKKIRENYKATFLYPFERDVDGLTKKQIKKKAKSFLKLFGGTYDPLSKKRKSNLRVKAFPAFSANSDDIRELLNDLEFSEGFISDVIIIDYIDILSKERGSFSEIDSIDKMWMNFKNIAAVRNSLVITADQAKAPKGGKEKISLGKNDWSDSKKKNAHIDMKISINQTEEEEEAKVMRIGLMMHRHKEREVNRQVMALQSLAIGQPMLDSEWCNY